jgi:hypothetical protein
MSNVKFLYEALETATFTASAGTATGYSLDNLADRNPNSKWRANAATNPQTLTIELATARAVNTVILDGHNILTAANDQLDLKIEHSENGSSWTEATALTQGDPGMNAITIFEFSSVTKKYWRVVLSQNTGDFAAAPEVGNAFLGTRFEPAVPYNSEVDRGEKFATTIVRALDSTPYASQRIPDGIETWKNLKWGNVSDAIANGFIALNTAVRGSGRPFYFIDTDDVARLVMLVGDTIAIKPKRYDINDVQLELQAFLPNTITAI